MKPKYIPSVEEGIREYYQLKDAPESLSDLIIEAREAVEEAGQEFFESPFVVDIGDVEEIGQGLLLMEAANFLAKRSSLDWDWYGLKDRIASALIREGAFWDVGESWGYACFYYWHPQVGQVSIHDPHEVVECGDCRPNLPQDWAEVSRQEYALLLLSNRAAREDMAEATDIRMSWHDRLPAIRCFYPEADEFGLYPLDEAA